MHGCKAADHLTLLLCGISCILLASWHSWRRLLSGPVKVAFIVTLGRRHHWYVASRMPNVSSFFIGHNDLPADRVARSVFSQMKFTHMYTWHAKDVIIAPCVRCVVMFMVNGVTLYLCTRLSSHYKNYLYPHDCFTSFSVLVCSMPVCIRLYWYKSSTTMFVSGISYAMKFSYSYSYSQ